jgi:hypothetical protein
VETSARRGAGCCGAARAARRRRARCARRGPSEIDFASRSTREMRVRRGRLALDRRPAGTDAPPEVGEEASARARGLDAVGDETHLILAPVEVPGLLRLEATARHDGFPSRVALATPLAYRFSRTNLARMRLARRGRGGDECFESDSAEDARTTRFDRDARCAARRRARRPRAVPRASAGNQTSVRRRTRARVTARTGPWHPRVRGEKEQRQRRRPTTAGWVEPPRR